MLNFNRRYYNIFSKKEVVIGQTYFTKGGCPEPFMVTNIIIPKLKANKLDNKKYVNIMYEGIYINRPHLGTCMIYAELINVGYEKKECKSGWWIKK